MIKTFPNRGYIFQNKLQNTWTAKLQTFANLLCPHPKTWNMIGKPLTSRWRLPKLCDCLTLVQSHIYFKITFFLKQQGTVVGKQNGKINCNEPSVKLKLLGLPHMVKTCPELTWLPQSFKPGCSLIHMANFDGNQISSLADFPTRASLKLCEIDER